jgi:hypothetical protein
VDYELIIERLKNIWREAVKKAIVFIGISPRPFKSKTANETIGY